MIRFLFKCAIFLGFLFVVISFFAPQSEKHTAQNTDNASTVDAILAVKDTVHDLSGFCERNSETCETGRSFFGSLGVRARDGAKFAYEYLDSYFGDSTPPQQDQSVKTGSIPAPKTTPEIDNDPSSAP